MFHLHRSSPETNDIHFLSASLTAGVILASGPPKEGDIKSKKFPVTCLWTLNMALAWIRAHNSHDCGSSGHETAASAEKMPGSTHSWLPLKRRQVEPEEGIERNREQRKKVLLGSTLPPHSLSFVAGLTCSGSPLFRESGSVTSQHLTLTLLKHWSVLANEQSGQMTTEGWAAWPFSLARWPQKVLMCNSA